MPTRPRILALAGSTREGSYNKKLARLAAAEIEKAGGDATYIDLRDYPMPLYDGDLEASQGLPEHALRFKHTLREHDGFILCCPEYNSSISAVMKNAIDWASRPSEKTEAPLVAFDGKVVGLMAASMGKLGGLRGLYHVREILLNINSIVLPTMYALSEAHTAFDDAGALKDEKAAAQIGAVVRKVVAVAGKIRA